MSQELKKENLKDTNYYRKMLHYDTIILLIVSTLFAIASVYFMGRDNGEDSVPILLKSVLFIVFEVIVLINKKDVNKLVGILAIINGILMFITSIVDRSLFGIVYLLLGIFYIIHSVIYLSKLKNLNYNEQVMDNNKKGNTKLKYLTLIPNILASLFILGIFQDEMTSRIIIFLTIIVINIVNVIFCIFLNKKYNKSILTYITMVISILAILINGIILIDDVGSEIRKNKKYDSEAYFIERCKNTEKAMSDKITLLENLTFLNVNIGEDTVIQFDDYLALDNVSLIDMRDFQDLENDGYVCDGYTILNWKSNLDITSYYDVSSKLSYPFDMKNYFNNVETYIKCSGKYTYQTTGFNNDLLK